MIKLAGLLFTLSAFTILLGTLTAEIFYPNYSVFENMINNLGATPPPSVIHEPSAAILDSTMIISGILVVVVSYCLFRAGFHRKTVVSISLLGIGALGVGVFPAYHVLEHPLVALLAFLFGGISALFCLKTTEAPFKYLSGVLGVLILGVLAVGVLVPFLIVPLLGRGGTERWVAYPLIIWMATFGGYLMNVGKLKKG